MGYARLMKMSHSNICFYQGLEYKKVFSNVSMSVCSRCSDFSIKRSLCTRHGQIGTKANEPMIESGEMADLTGVCIENNPFY